MRHDLTSLEIFVAVAECGNLTRAALRQHLAVSAISKRIGELEALTSTALLVRLPRGVSLTPAGQSLLHHARQILRGVERMEAELGEYAGGVKGHVRLHAVASALTQFLPAELDAFLTRHPLVRLSLEERTGRAIVLAVADGTADLGIITGHTPAPGLTAYPYHSDKLMIAVSVDHPLARRKSVRFADALAYPFVGPHAESSLSALMVEGAKACGKPLEQRIQVSSFDTMCRMVGQRLGITMLPQGVLAPHAAGGRLRMLTLKEPWAVRHLSIVVRDPEGVGHVARSLITHLGQAAGSTRR
jgi:DNA-binding transcriptional LysR family regulator